MWNFKGTLWNSTQNILPIHWKIRFLYNIEILRALRCKSSKAFLKRPPLIVLILRQCPDRHSTEWYFADNSKLIEATHSCNSLHSHQIASYLCTSKRGKCCEQKNARCEFITNRSEQNHRKKINCWWHFLGKIDPYFTQMYLRPAQHGLMVQRKFQIGNFEWTKILW